MNSPRARGYSSHLRGLENNPRISAKVEIYARKVRSRSANSFQQLAFLRLLPATRFSVGPVPTGESPWWKSRPSSLPVIIAAVNTLLENLGCILREKDIVPPRHVIGLTSSREDSSLRSERNSWMGVNRKSGRPRVFDTSSSISNL